MLARGPQKSQTSKKTRDRVLGGWSGVSRVTLGPGLVGDQTGLGSNHTGRWVVLFQPTHRCADLWMEVRAIRQRASRWAVLYTPPYMS